MSLLSFFHRLKEWVVNHQTKVLFFVALLLVGVLSFESGLLRGKLVKAEPLVITLPAIPVVTSPGSEATGSGNQEGNMERTVVSLGNQIDGPCPLIGSKNSNKYHLSTCAVAKRIKPENRICFASKEEAEKRGYIASCIK